MRRIVSVDRGEAVHLQAAVAAADLALDPMAVAQRESADDFRRDKNIGRALDEVPLRIAQKAESLAGNFDDPLGKDRLLLRIGLALGGWFGRGRLVVFRALRTILPPEPLLPVRTLESLMAVLSLKTIRGAAAAGAGQTARCFRGRSRPPKAGRR